MSCNQALIRRPMTPAWQHDGITITWSNISAPTTIVVFTSFGVPPSPVAATEFHDMFLTSPTPFNLINVIDYDRRYYIDGRLADVAGEINRLIGLTGAHKSIAVGVSMGGFAAVAYARRLEGCSAVIAMGANSSIHRSIVPFDTRAPEWRSRIKEWDVLDCTKEVAEGIDYDLIYGTEDDIDRCHAARFSSLELDNVRVTLVAGSDHNVAAFWNTQGVMQRELLERAHAMSFSNRRQSY